MSRKIKFSHPKLQADFAFVLKHFRATYLQNALFQTIKTMQLTKIDQQLAQYAPEKDLSFLAQYGLRGELLFAVPIVLEKNPYLLGYYRLLMGYSQKEFYGADKGFGAGPFKAMEKNGKINRAIAGDIPELCTAFCEAASFLLCGLEGLTLNKELFDDLTLLTVGPQLRGGANNQLGSASIVKVFEVIRKIVAHSATAITGDSIVVKSATGRNFLIEFAPDPDIIIREEMSPDQYRNILAIEIKGGTDVSNIHNRIGEAEKSHQKARLGGYTECWTVTNVNRLSLDKARAESPSTDRFYHLESLVCGTGTEYEDFQRRIISLVAISSSPNL